MKAMKVCRIEGEADDADIKYSYDTACTPEVYAEEHLRVQVEEIAIDKFKAQYGDVTVLQVTWYDYPSK